MTKKKVAPVVPEGKVIIKTPQKRDSGKTNWRLTIPLFLDLFGPVAPYNSLEDVFQKLKKSNAVQYTFQLEEGSENGYLHWQIYFKHSSKVRFSTLKKIWGIGRIDVADYPKKASDYSSKIDTRVAGPYIYPEPPYEYNGEDLITDLFDWQVNLKDYLLQKKADPRKILWIWDDPGNLGKTEFAKYMTWHHDAFICTTGKHSDIKHLISEYEPWKKPKPIFIFNLPRAYKDCSTIYQLLEELKDGILMSGKYEGCVKLFAKPHIVVLANFEPQIKQLSQDRWCIKNLKSD